jgi:hypothetical protein
MGELNIIAAILTVRPLNDTSLPTAIHIDPARNIAVQTVTLYERIIEELLGTRSWTGGVRLGSVHGLRETFRRVAASRSRRA